MWWREDVERGLQMWGLEGPCSPLPLPRDNKDSIPSGNSRGVRRGLTCAPRPRQCGRGRGLRGAGQLLGRGYDVRVVSSALCHVWRLLKKS